MSTSTTETGSNFLLLTARPGLGKTTAIRKVAATLLGWRLGGFYTEEIRTRGERTGFKLVTFDGRERVMAELRHEGPRVSKYGVHVEIVDWAAESVLASDAKTDVYLVDEIGKMECLSGKFVTAMRTLIDAHRPLVATVAHRGEGFIEEVKRHPDAEIWHLTLANRDVLPSRFEEWIKGRVTRK